MNFCEGLVWCGYQPVILQSYDMKAVHSNASTVSEECFRPTSVTPIIQKYNTYLYKNYSDLKNNKLPSSVRPCLFKKHSSLSDRYTGYTLVLQHALDISLYLSHSKLSFLYMYLFSINIIQWTPKPTCPDAFSAQISDRWTIFE